MESEEPAPGRHKIVYDNVWEEIPLDATQLQFIDTEPFQRLRSLHQLGAAHYVFPGGVHTRFQHSIGVCVCVWLKLVCMQVMPSKSLCVCVLSLIHI